MQAGVLDTGERIPPSMARRLAREAGVIPVVLGGDSQPLDVGRKRRLYADLANGISLCSWHHHRAHDTNYRTTYHPTGRVQFHRRT